MVAVTEHDPVPAEMETTPDESMVQAVDEPADHTIGAFVVPPDVDNVTVAPNAALEVPDTVSDAWVPLTAEIEAVADVA